MEARYDNHPKIINEEGRRLLPPSNWHPKIIEHYPVDSPAELFRRASHVFYQELADIYDYVGFRDLFLMQPAPNLLDIVDDPVDIVGCTLIDQQTQ